MKVLCHLAGTLFFHIRQSCVWQQHQTLQDPLFTHDLRKRLTLSAVTGAEMRSRQTEPFKLTTVTEISISKDVKRSLYFIVDFTHTKKGSGAHCTLIYTCVDLCYFNLITSLFATMFGPGELSRDSLRTGWYGDRIPVGVSFSTPIQTGPRGNSTSSTMGTGSYR
jgi:hypothetical protein